MTAERSTNKPLLCPQCGGEVRIDEPRLFVTCSYCASALWVDKTRVVFHWYVPPTLDETQARAALARWMADGRRATVLGSESVVRSVSFFFFPMWVVRTGDTREERIVVAPAAATSVDELKRLQLPAGEMRRYEAGLNLAVRAPNVSLEIAMRGSIIAETADKAWQEISLVHMPVYVFKYDFHGRSYTAIVEGSTGSVFASIYPPTRVGAYEAVAVVTAVAYHVLVFQILGAGVLHSWVDVAAQAQLLVWATALLILWATRVARG